MEELKPCPFCGRIPIVDDCGDNSFFIRCKCRIAQDKLYGQRCDAVRRWNTRRKQPERKKGIWIKTGQSFVFPEKFRNYSCSECGYDVDKTKFNFCPNCGADMREDQDG